MTATPGYRFDRRLHQWVPDDAMPSRWDPTRRSWVDDSLDDDLDGWSHLYRGWANESPGGAHLLREAVFFIDFTDADGLPSGWGQSGPLEWVPQGLRSTGHGYIWNPVGEVQISSETWSALVSVVDYDPDRSDGAYTFRMGNVFIIDNEDDWNLYGGVAAPVIPDDLLEPENWSGNASRLDVASGNSAVPWNATGLPFDAGGAGIPPTVAVGGQDGPNWAYVAVGGSPWDESGVDLDPAAGPLFQQVEIDVRRVTIRHAAVWDRCLTIGEMRNAAAYVLESL